MPYINIRITREGATAEQKAALIEGATELLVRVLGKEPDTTFVVIDEVDLESWGVGGVPVPTFRARRAQRAATTPVTTATPSTRRDELIAGAYAPNPQKPAGMPGAAVRVDVGSEARRPRSAHACQQQGAGRVTPP